MVSQVPDRLLAQLMRDVKIFQEEAGKLNWKPRWSGKERKQGKLGSKKKERKIELRTCFSQASLWSNSLIEQVVP